MRSLGTFIICFLHYSEFTYVLYQDLGYLRAHGD
jgi:hypothetical protein